MREAQCLSNTEWVASHICPCRVCEGEREVLRAFLFFPQWTMPAEIYLGNVTPASPYPHQLPCSYIKTHVYTSLHHLVFGGGLELEDASIFALCLAKWTVFSSCCQQPFPFRLTVTLGLRRTAQLQCASFFNLLALP